MELRHTLRTAASHSAVLGCALEIQNNNNEILVQEDDCEHSSHLLSIFTTQGGEPKGPGGGGQIVRCNC